MALMALRASQLSPADTMSRESRSFGENDAGPLRCHCIAMHQSGQGSMPDRGLAEYVLALAATRHSTRLDGWALTVVAIA